MPNRIVEIFSSLSNDLHDDVYASKNRAFVYWSYIDLAIALVNFDYDRSFFTKLALIPNLEKSMDDCTYIYCDRYNKIICLINDTSINWPWLISIIVVKRRYNACKIFNVIAYNRYKFYLFDKKIWFFHSFFLLSKHYLICAIFFFDTNMIENYIWSQLDRVFSLDIYLIYT